MRDRWIVGALALALLGGGGLAWSATQAPASEAAPYAAPATSTISPATAAPSEPQTPIEVSTDAPVVDGAAAPLPGDPAATTPATSTAITRHSMAPSTILIPALGVYAPLVPAALDGGTVPLPPDPGKLTVLTSAAAPCAQAGAVLIAGHVRNRGVTGALWALASLKPGAVAYVRCADGQVETWTATGTPTANLKGTLSRAELTRTTGTRVLRVITCGGPVITRPDGSRHFRDNVVATFTP